MQSNFILLRKNVLKYTEGFRFKVNKHFFYLLIRLLYKQIVTQPVIQEFI